MLKKGEVFCKTFFGWSTSDFLGGRKHIFFLVGRNSVFFPPSFSAGRNQLLGGRKRTFWMVEKVIFWVVENICFGVVEKGECFGVVEQVAKGNKKCQNNKINYVHGDQS